MAWQSVTVPLTAGAGVTGGVSQLTKANLPFNNEGAPLILHSIYVPTQQGVLATTDIVISKLLPDGLLSTVVTITNITTPFEKPIENLYSDATATVTTNYIPQVTTGVNVQVAQGNGSFPVTVWLLFL